MLGTQKNGAMPAAKRRNFNAMPYQDAPFYLTISGIKSNC